jgi:iron complex transport system substrate-binding protein
MARTVTDLAGRTIKVPDNVGQIIALRGALSIVCYLDLVDRVVGVEHHEAVSTRWVGSQGRPYRMANPQLGHLPVIGSRNKPQPEKIIKLHPDIIFIGSGAMRIAKQLQRQTGIPVVVLDLGDLGAGRKRFFKSLQLVGEICEKEKRAKAVIGKIKECLVDFEQRTAGIPLEKRKKVYLGGIQFKVAHGLLGTSRDYPPFELIHAENIVKSLPVKKKLIRGRMSIKRETFINLAPEVIFICESGLELVFRELKEPLYRELPAIRAGKVYGLMPHYYATAPATVLAETYYIGKTLYPDRFQDIEIPALSDALYTFFVGGPLYKKMAKIFGGFKPLAELQ